MKKSLAYGLNTILSPLGCKIVGAGSATIQKSRYDATVAEIESLCRATLFPAIPENKSRVLLMTKLLGTQIVESLFLLNELHASLNLGGDICEFGIAQGATSALIANEIRGTDKLLWLFDSFEGLPRPKEQDKLIDDIFNLGSIEKYQGTMAVGKDDVLSRLKDIQFPLSRVKIVPGFIETTAKKTTLPPQVCFAYVDFDFYEPILIALRMLSPKLPVGGRIVIDDYGFFSEGAQVAVDEFVAESKEMFNLTLPPNGCGHFAMLRKVRTI